MKLFHKIRNWFRELEYRKCKHCSQPCLVSAIREDIKRTKEKSMENTTRDISTTKDKFVCEKCGKVCHYSQPSDNSNIFIYKSKIKFCPECGRKVDYDLKK